MTEVAHARPGFAQSVVIALRRYTDFEGRSTRAEFWWYALFYTLVITFCNVFSFAQLGPNATLGSVLSSIFMILTLLPTLAIGVRRLRDAGLGWKNMFWLLLPIAGLIILIIYWARPTKPEASWDTARWSI